MGRVKFEILKTTAKVECIEDDVYFGEYKDYVSNSRLSLINPEENGSFEKYRKGFIDSGPKSYFNLGTAFHNTMLQPESYKMSDIRIPKGKDGDIIMDIVRKKKFDCDLVFDSVKSFSTELQIKNEAFLLKKSKYIIEEYSGLIVRMIDELKNYKGTMFLSESDYDKFTRCIEGFSSNKDICSIMNPNPDLGFESFNEMTFFLDIKAEYCGKETVLKLKGKVDNYNFNDISYNINDLKTSFHSNGMFSSSVKRFHYKRQAAFYKLLLDSYFSSIGSSAKMKSFNFLFTSTSDGSSGIYKMKKNDFAEGFKELRYLLELVALSQMFKDNMASVEYYGRTYSLGAIAASYTEKFKLISLLLFLLQRFREKDKGYSFLRMFERIRKDKLYSTSQSMYERLEAIVESNYSETEVYPTFKMQTAKEMAEYINNILDKEMPFSNNTPWILDDDLPF